MTDIVAMWQERQRLADALDDDWPQDRYDVEQARVNALDDRILAAKAATIGDVVAQLRCAAAAAEWDRHLEPEQLTALADRLEAMAGRAGP